MTDNNNELITVEENEISQYLEQCGIHGEWLNQYINPEKMPKLGYSEVNRSDIGALDMVFSHMPGMITNAINSSGVYRVTVESGKHLMRTKDGKLTAELIDNATNRLSGHGALNPVSTAPLVANAVFSALSMVTGQYFLSEINDKFSHIEKNLEGIKHFLEIEKRSDLLANQYFISEVFNTIRFIQSNELQKQATILQLQSIRRSSYGNMCFYNSVLNEKKFELEQLKSNSKKNMKKIPEVINGIGNNAMFYKFALYTYHQSYLLELILSENSDSQYIEHVNKDLKNRTNSYRKFVGYYTNEMNAFLNTTKAYDINNALDIFAMLVGINAGFVILKSPQIGLMVTSAITSKSEEKKKEARNEVVKQVNKIIDDCQDCSPFTKIENSLEAYNRLMNNSNLELVYDDKRAYLKCSDFKTK